MSFFSRLSNGWSLAQASFSVIKKHQQLIIFPILSGFAFLVVIASFIGIIQFYYGFEMDRVIEESSALDYLITFVYYLISYFVIIFFNVGLAHCTKIYLEGGEPTVKAGFDFAKKRIPTIFAWSTLSATVGLILKFLEENAGFVGEILSGIIGVAWSIATYFVVPILAYEDIGPVQALKRSSLMMKEKWGESLGAAFSFGIISFLCILLIALPLGLLFGFFAHPLIGFAIGALAAFLIHSIISASEIVFITTIYQQINGGDQIDEFGSVDVDDLFKAKKKSRWV